MDSVDVLVVGSGPAGSTAARFAAEAGASVLMIERRSQVGVPVRCGEFMPGASEIKFMFPELEDYESLFAVPDSLRCLDIKGIKLVDPKNKVTLLDFDGYTTDRDRFDQYLAKLAVEEGAVLERNCLFKGIEGGVAKTSQGDVRYKVIVGADGSYRFDELPSGRYLVAFEGGEMDAKATAPVGVGGDDSKDSDAMPSIEDGVLASAVISGIILPSASDMIEWDYESADNDLGLVPYARAIEDEVFTARNVLHSQAGAGKRGYGHVVRQLVLLDDDRTRIRTKTQIVVRALVSRTSHVFESRQNDACYRSASKDAVVDGRRGIGVDRIVRTGVFRRSAIGIHPAVGENDGVFAFRQSLERI